jgi:hypothetical protein
MSTFANRRLRLDKKVFAKLSDGTAVIDGIEIAVMFDKASFQFGDSRGTEKIITISQVMADELSLKPKTKTKVEFHSSSYDLAHPPIYEDGLIKLILV